MVCCKLCGKKFKIITNTHLLSSHNFKLKDYIKRFGLNGCKITSPGSLPKADKRYKAWLKSLEKRPGPWNKGLKKEEHPSVRKISETFKKKKIDNFSKWRGREKVRKNWLTEDNCPELKRNGDLAELIGVVLGDGHIYKYPRTEGISIFSNANNPGFVKRYSVILEKVFEKKPSNTKHGKGCIKIELYQKYISRRINLPAGSRARLDFKTPTWILQKRVYLIRFLRGLYEAEGSFCVHKPTYTYKFFFSNRNESLLNTVFFSLKTLGFHLHRSKNNIQISRKEEVLKAKKLIKFRVY